MINADKRTYDYYLMLDDDGYGQPAISEEPEGTVNMTINVSTQAISDSVAYSDSEFIGLTHADVNDKFIIQYGEDRLKVLYIIPKGRLKQVFMARM